MGTNFRITVAVLATLLLVTGSVFAGNAHFVGTPKITISGNTVTVSGKVAGLGNVPAIHVDVSGDAQCVNPGRQEPNADNKDEFSASGNFPVQNGKALFSLILTAAFQPDCSPPMSVSWSNISIDVYIFWGTPDQTLILSYP